MYDEETALTGYGEEIDPTGSIGGGGSGGAVGVGWMRSVTRATTVRSTSAGTNAR